MAVRFDLPVAKLSDSQDLCFLGDSSYKKFLHRNADQVISPGPILSNEGKQLGRHQGLAFYTIGQRKGIGVSSSEPLYVIDKLKEGNALIVGPADRLGRSELIASGVNWIADEPPKNEIRADIKIRYQSPTISGRIIPQGDQSVRVIFDEPVRDITPGQAAVFYNKEYCLGGGIIQG